MWRRIALVVTALVVLAAAGWYYRWRDTPFAVTGASLVWTPRMGALGRPPTPQVRTSLGAVPARRLATAIAATPRAPRGPVVCPGDDGSKVVVGFSSRLGPYPSVAIELTGCAGPSGRMMTDRLRHLLVSEEPAGFRQ